MPPLDSIDEPDSLYRSTVKPDYVPSLADVGAAELADFRDLGFLAVSEGFASATPARAIDELSRLVGDPPAEINVQFEDWAGDDVAGWSAERRLDAVRRLMRFVGSSPDLQTIAYDPEILRVVSQILGSDDIVLSQDMALLKPPGGGREKPWHQDKAFFNLDLDAPVVGVWIALDAATPENGCMHVIPRSHREGPMPHFARRDWQICDSSVATARDVVVPLEPGGVLLFDGYLHHGTPANRTGSRRRALQFHYVRSDTVTITDDERMAVFGLEGRGVEC
ncbi:MAG TPA: phytanoyl-CoA dioxygenase family protein [Microlunatus sp.]